MPIQIKHKGPSKPSQNVYDQHMTAIAPTGVVTVQKTNSPFLEKTVPVANPQVIPESELYKISVQGSQTVNLGNYESVKVGVVLTVPCTKNDMETTYQFACDWVSEKIAEAVKQAKQ